MKGYFRNLFGAIFATEPSSTPDPADPFWYQDPGSGMLLARGVTSADAALHIGAVYRAVDLLSGSIAMLPIAVMKETEKGRVEDRKHLVGVLLRKKPNVWQTSFEWRRMMAAHVLLRGNAYCWKVTNGRGEIEQLVPLHPARVIVEQLASHRRRYQYTWPDGRRDTFLDYEILHLTALSSDGLVGLSPVSLMRRTLQFSGASEDFVTRQFTQRPMISGVLKAPGKLTLEQRKATAASFREAWSGTSGQHGVPVLEAGMEWTQVGMSNADAEFLASRKFSRTEIATWFGVPPHMIGDLERATFSNIEHLAIHYGRFSVGPWVTNFEERFNRDLLEDSDTHSTHFDRDPLERGDLLSRYTANRIATGGAAWLSPDEVREQDGWNPRGGEMDEVRQPLNTAGPSDPNTDPGAPPREPPAPDAPPEEPPPAKPKPKPKPKSPRRK